MINAAVGITVSEGERKVEKLKSLGRAALRFFSDNRVGLLIGAHTSGLAASRIYHGSDWSFVDGLVAGLSAGLFFWSWHQLGKAVRK